MPTTGGPTCVETPFAAGAPGLFTTLGASAPLLSRHAQPTAGGFAGVGGLRRHSQSRTRGMERASPQPLLQKDGPSPDALFGKSGDPGSAQRARSAPSSRTARLYLGAVGQDEIRCTEWKISDLIQPSAYWEGVAALAHADVIVVSLNAADRLPGAFYLWVNLWLQERSGRPGVLVALLVAPEESTSGANETRRYLSAVASQGHLDFLIRECNRPSETIREVEEDIRVSDICAALHYLQVTSETRRTSTTTVEDPLIAADQSRQLAA